MKNNLKITSPLIFFSAAVTLKLVEAIDLERKKMSHI